MSDTPIRTGDYVTHKPSGERWVVAYVKGEYLAWCGWPEGEALLADCERYRTATDDEHWDLVERIAKSDAGARTRYCRRLLESRVE